MYVKKFFNKWRKAARVKRAIRKQRVFKAKRQQRLWKAKHQQRLWAKKYYPKYSLKYKHYGPNFRVLY